MKKKFFIIILSIILTAAAGTVAYFYLSGAFQERDLKAINIQQFDDNAPAGTDIPERFLLSPSEKTRLYQALSLAANVEEGELTEKQINQRYQMVLDNRWGFSREYTVFFADDTTVFLQDRYSVLFKIQEPDFFYSHDGFKQIYAGRFVPRLQVALNNDFVPFTLSDQHWEYQGYDDRWHTQLPDDHSGPVTEDDVAIRSAEDKLNVQSDKPPDQAHLKIVDSATGNIVFENQVNLNQLPFPGRNGKFNYELTLEWCDEEKPCRGRAVIRIPVICDLPVQFVFSKQRLIQGDMLQISVYYAENPGDIIFEQSIYNGFQWYRQDGMLLGYIPTNYNTKPGRYRIQYGSSEGATDSAEIEVVQHCYHIQYLEIDEQVEQETRNDAAYEEFAKYFTPARRQSAPDRYYTEPFMLPVKGELTTEFGQTRYVNGTPDSSRHSGWDIAASKGTVIQAANRGKVVLARPLTLTGNTVVIDHGQGLFSVYYHMNEMSVTAGRMVERGQKIGTVGSTGFSTGPHLHFILSYYAINMEPGFLLVGEPVTFANYHQYLQ